MAVDRADANVYPVVQDARFSGFRYDTIAFTQSTDGGRSWSPLIRINPGSDAGARVDDRHAFTAGRPRRRRRVMEIRMRRARALTRGSDGR